MSLLTLQSLCESNMLDCEITPAMCTPLVELIDSHSVPREQHDREESHLSTPPSIPPSQFYHSLSLSMI